MGRRVLTSLLVCGMATVLLASCGSSKKSTSASTTIPTAMTQGELARQADAICQKYDSQVSPPPSNINPNTANAAQLKQIAPFLRARANAIRTEVQQVRALGAPQTGAAQLSRLLSGGKSSAAQISAAAVAAQNGDVKAFRTDFAKLQRNNVPATAARKFGLKVCAQGSG